MVSVFADLLYQPPLPALLAMARATSRVRLGAACLNPYTQHPYEIAGSVAALDAAAPGRAYLGLARGTWLESIGIDQRRPLAHLRDTAAIVRALLSGDDSGYAGEAYRLEPGTRLRYRLPDRPPPLLIGAWGQRGAALASEIADELKVGGTASPAVVRIVCERVTGRLPGRASSRRRRRVVAGAVTVVDEDGAAARRRARTEVAKYLAVVAELDPAGGLPAGLADQSGTWSPAGDDIAAGELIPDEVLDRFAFSGTPEQVAALAQAVLDAGAGRIDFGTPHGLSDTRRRPATRDQGSAAAPPSYHLERARRIARPLGKGESGGVPLESGRSTWSPGRRPQSGAVMRKAAITCGVIGIVLLVAGGLLAWWITPTYIARLPSNYNKTRTYTGTIRSAG